MGQLLKQQRHCSQLHELPSESGDYQFHFGANRPEPLKHSSNIKLDRYGTAQMQSTGHPVTVHAITATAIQNTILSALGNSAHF